MDSPPPPRSLSLGGKGGHVPGTKSRGPRSLPPRGGVEGEQGYGDQESPSSASLWVGGRGLGPRAPILCLPRGGRVAGVGDQEPPSSASLGEGGWQGSGTKSPILCLPRGGRVAGVGDQEPHPLPPSGREGGRGRGPRAPILCLPRGGRVAGVGDQEPHLCLPRVGRVAGVGDQEPYPLPPGRRGPVNCIILCLPWGGDQ